jgi:hypothetical protein
MAHPFIIGGVLVLSVAGSVALIDLATAPVCAASAANEYRDSGGMRGRRSYRRYGMRSSRRYAERRSSERRAQPAADRPAPVVGPVPDGGRVHFDETFGAWTVAGAVVLPALRVPPMQVGEADDVASPNVSASSVSPCQ